MNADDKFNTDCSFQMRRKSINYSSQFIGDGRRTADAPTLDRREEKVGDSIIGDAERLSHSSLASFFKFNYHFRNEKKINQVDGTTRRARERARDGDIC